jgi:acetyltransferase-like isoleucine patch superfamily enzyme
MLIQKPRMPIREIMLTGFLPNPLKKILYRLKGYRLGKGVRIGFGSVICGDEVSIGSHTSVGFLTIIRGKEITIGSHVQIGAMVFLDTPHIQIGDGSKFNEQVYVGGLQFPDSRFVVGRNCQIMQMTFINPAVSVTIGDDSGIGGHCLVFGHTSWLSAFEGYPVEFKPIRIGRSVSVAWGAFLLPGTDIGDGAVIGAHSMVSRQIPPRCLALGYPARVVSKYPDFPREVSASEKAELLKSIVEEMIRVFQSSGLVCRRDGETVEVSRKKSHWWTPSGKRWRFHTLFDAPSAGELARIGTKLDVLLSLSTLPADWRLRLAGQGTLWIDLERKEQADLSNDLGDEVLLFLKRYGVRCFRV